ncbi:MAG TPA: TolC family protein [Thermoanaerobaculia bacterium]|nr:TolC family protein [Thermoanaerobaculia bacterium]
MTAFRRLITTVLLSLAATGLFAQTQTPAPRSTEPVSAETDQDVNNARALRLSLDDAVRTSLERNLGIQVQRFETRMAGQNLRGSHGAFDPVATADITQSSAESTSITQFEGGSTRGTALNFGFRGLVPTGGEYTAGFSNSRRVRSGFGTTLSPGYSSNLNFAATQPLLRDFGLDINRRAITIARNTLGITQEGFRTVLMDTTTAVEQAYLDLVYARRNIEVVKEALFLARDQSRITQIRIDVGASAPLDILQPRVQIATSEETLISATASVRNAEDRLRQLLNLDPADWDRPIIPTTDVDFTPTTINVADAVQRAMTLRPELRQQNFANETLKVQYLYARNQTLPLLDFNLGYGVSGIGGRTLDPQTGNPDPTVNSTGYFNSLQSIFENDFPSWNVGFNFALPLTRIGQRAEAKRAELDLRQGQTTLEQQRQNIMVDVRNTARAVDTAARSIAASRTAREAAERNVEAERKRYENGMTTNFQVLQVQQQLSDARVRELNALVGYAIALSAYHRAVGDTLDVRGITVEAPEPVDEPNFFPWLDRYNWLNYGSHVRLEEPTK